MPDGDGARIGQKRFASLRQVNAQSSAEDIGGSVDEIALGKDTHHVRDGICVKSGAVSDVRLRDGVIVLSDHPICDVQHAPESECQTMRSQLAVEVAAEARSAVPLLDSGVRRVLGWRKWRPWPAHAGEPGEIAFV